MAPLRDVLASVTRHGQVGGHLHSVEREDDGNHWTGITIETHGGLEGGHSDNRGHEGAIVSVGAGAAEGREDGKVEVQRLLATGIDVGLLDGGEELGLEGTLVGTETTGKVGLPEQTHIVDHLLLATLHVALDAASLDTGRGDWRNRLDAVRGDGLLDAVRVLGTARRHGDGFQTSSWCRRRCREKGRLATKRGPDSRENDI